MSKRQFVCSVCLSQISLLTFNSIWEQISTLCWLFGQFRPFLCFGDRFWDSFQNWDANFDVSVSICFDLYYSVELSLLQPMNQLSFRRNWFPVSSLPSRWSTFVLRETITEVPEVSMKSLVDRLENVDSVIIFFVLETDKERRWW